MIRLRSNRVFDLLGEHSERSVARLLVRLASGFFAVTVASSLLLTRVAGQSPTDAYLVWLGGLVHGDLGMSLRTGHGVANDLLVALPASLALLVVATVVGVGLGVALALPVGFGLPGRLPRLLLTALGALPGYALALLLLLLFWYYAGLAPAPGGAGVGRALLPILTLAIPVAVAVARPLAFSLAVVMQQGYFASARAAGLSVFQATLRHGVRNALPSALAAIGLQFGTGLITLIVVERIFGWPGVGLYFARALATADRPAMIGASLAFATVYMLADIAIAAARALADPRLRAP